jgi:Right handed beta helix region
MKLLGQNRSRLLLFLGWFFMKLVRFSWLLVLTVSAAHGSTWHVSPQSLPAVPANEQFPIIQEAAKVAEAGDTVLIHSGVYRESVVIEKSGTPQQPIRFEAAPASDVIITGLDPLTDWHKENDGQNVYSIAWPYRFIPSSKTDAYPDDEYHRLIGRAEQVVENDHALRQTLQRNDVSAGSFYVDLAAKRLYISPFGNEDLTAPNGNIQIEGATRSLLWHCKGAYVTLRGIRFRYAANRAQQGAAVFQGRADGAEDCVFERMNSLGAAFVAPDQVARNCTFQDNGQLGFSALRAHNLLFTGCTVRNNNTKGFNRQWEAGGDKIVLSRGVVLEKSRFIANHGSGIWFDIGNENCTVQNCLIANNEDAGLYCEISYGLHANDNVAVGNGFATTPGAWGAQAGIVLSSSPNCVVTRNLLVRNREGFNFREQPRITSRIDHPEANYQEQIWNHDEQIRNNVIAYNRDAQTRGWFAVSDKRHWPRKMQQPVTSASAVSSISLETLKLDCSHNLYARENKQPLFIWGANWMWHVDYPTVAAVQSQLNLEKESREFPLVFADYAKRDFRLPRNSAAFSMDCYPRGEVPDVILGATN